MRFALRLDWWWLPFLLPAGVLPATAYVVLEARAVRVRFGFFRFTVERQRIERARQVAGSWWHGIGVHTDLLHWLCVAGSLAGLVELRLEPPQRFWVLCFPVRCTRFLLSLEDPGGFLRALTAPTAVR